MASKRREQVLHCRTSQVLTPVTLAASVGPLEVATKNDVIGNWSLVRVVAIPPMWIDPGKSASHVRFAFIVPNLPKCEEFHKNSLAVSRQSELPLGPRDQRVQPVCLIAPGRANTANGLFFGYVFRRRRAATSGSASFAPTHGIAGRMRTGVPDRSSETFESKYHLVSARSGIQWILDNSCVALGWRSRRGGASVPHLKLIIGSSSAARSARVLSNGIFRRRMAFTGCAKFKLLNRGGTLFQQL